ncbi:MAG TPA: hypothetical protein VGN78_09035 [Solirubrobacteraceae bacterium]|jgi:hypothetical protein|nr:hypothetical protein [Solirubrobacteraceae bacterium]
MSAPPLDAVAATLRDFVARAGALRAVALLDRGAGAAPIVIDCDDAGAVEVEENGEARGVTVASDSAPLALVHVHALPAMDVDPASGDVTGTIGGLQHLAGAVGELAAALGGRSVATVQFQTSNPDAPLAVSARPGEPPVFALGDETFGLP